MVEKKNPDYSASAVNLTNHEDVKEALDELHGSQKYLAHLQVVLKERNEELMAEIDAVAGTISGLAQNIRTLIDTHGSYQDIEAGAYAVKQMRKTVSYEPALVRDNLDVKCAAMVIIESVDKVSLGRLVKAGIVSQEQADLCGIAKIDYAYIIK